MKIKLALNDGETAEVYGHKFAYDIDGVRYWFAYHKPLNSTSGLQVTHIDSGYRVTDVGHNKRAAHMDDKSAAKSALDDLVAKVGAPRVRSVIDGARSLITVQP